MLRYEVKIRVGNCQYEYVLSTGQGQIDPHYNVLVEDDPWILTSKLLSISTSHIVVCPEAAYQGHVMFIYYASETQLV